MGRVGSPPPSRTPYLEGGLVAPEWVAYFEEMSSGGGTTPYSHIDHRHDGHTLECDAINSDGGTFTFYTTGGIQTESSSGTNTFLGVSVAGAGILSGATDNVLTGYKAGYDITSGDRNIIIGASAGENTTGGVDNVYIGYKAGFEGTVDSYNTVIGSEALEAKVTGQFNTVIGYKAAFGVGGATEKNVFIGMYAGYGDGSASTHNVCVGYSAGYFWENQDSVAIGESAGYYNKTGDSNTLVGFEAGKGVNGNNFSNNTFLGYRAGVAITTGGNNVCVGFQAGDVLTTGSSNIIIGYDVDPSAADATNEINIGGVYKGDTSTSAATLAGTVTITTINAETTDVDTFLVSNSGLVKSRTGAQVLSDIDGANVDHDANHITGGSDEIDGDKLDIDWTPTNYAPSTSPSESDNVDNLTAHLKGIDTLVGAHASRHITGAADEIDADKADIDWTPTNYTPSTSPSEADNVDNLTAHLKGIDTLIGIHASRHLTGGGDEVDGDKLDIDWTPTNYTPSTSPSEADNADNLTAHLKGIDTYAGSKVDSAGAVSAVEAAGLTLASTKAYQSVDGDTTHTFGRCVVFAQYSDYAAFGHRDQTAAGCYAFMQGANGATYINAVSGQPIYFRLANVTKGQISSTGLWGVGPTSPAAQLHVDQSSTTAAVPTLYLDQADVSEEMIEFNTTIGTGNAIEAVGAKSLTTTHFIKVTIPGPATVYIPCGTIA